MVKNMGKDTLLDTVVKDARESVDTQKATMQFILTISSLCRLMCAYNACDDNSRTGFCETRMRLVEALRENSPSITDEQLMLFAEMQWTVSGYDDNFEGNCIGFESRNGLFITNPFIDESGRFPINMIGACTEYGKKNVDEWCRKATDFIMNFKGYQGDEYEEEEE